MPRTRVASEYVVPGLGHRHPVVPEVGQQQFLAGAGRRWRAGWRSCACGPWAAGPPGPPPGHRLRQRAPRDGSCASTTRAVPGGRGWSCTSDMGTWCERQVPSVWQPVDHLRPGPALGGAQHDHRPSGPGGAAFFAGGSLDGGDLLHDLVEGRRHQLVHLGRLVARHPVHRSARNPPASLVSSSSPMRASTVGLAIL